MATPTISKYTAHLRVDKAGMREQLLNANIETKESDTFTDLSKKILEKSNAIRRIYVQPDEPASKHGLWFKRDAVEDFDVVSDPVPFVGGTLSAFNLSYNPDSAYTKIKETKTIHANNTLYYLVMDNLKDSYPDESFRIYEYDPYTNAYTKIQTYTGNEVYNVRGDAGYYPLAVFKKNCVACIDSEGEYLYLICGGYDATSESQKYITRFGLKSHSAERVHTKLSNWFPIPAGDLSNAQIVDNKIYVFGQSTNAASYGNTWNTRIIDLNTGSESTLNHGPIAYQGRTIKVNSHLIAGFGGGASSTNSGQGMNEVRLFDTLTNTSTKIATLTNKNNSRALAVVGNLIYFVEYRSSGSVADAIGFVDLSDYSVTYIDDAFTPKLQNTAVSPAIYLPSARAIMFGNALSQTYLYNLNTKPYDKDTAVLFQSTGVAAQYVVDLFTTNNFKTDIPFNISDAWFYKVGEGLETTGEVYYGNGTEWLPLIHGNTNGGVNALQLQHKIVEITEKGTTYVTPDAGFEGLRYVDVIANKVSKYEDPDPMGIGIVSYHNNGLINELDVVAEDVPATYISGSGSVVFKDITVINFKNTKILQNNAINNLTLVNSVTGTETIERIFKQGLFASSNTVVKTPIILPNIKEVQSQGYYMGTSKIWLGSSILGGFNQDTGIDIMPEGEWIAGGWYLDSAGTLKQSYPGGSSSLVGWADCTFNQVIQVQENTMYNLVIPSSVSASTPTRNAVAYYDENFRRITYTNEKTNSSFRNWKFTTPAGTKYILLYLYYVNVAAINAGAYATLAKALPTNADTKCGLYKDSFKSGSTIYIDLPRATVETFDYYTFAFCSDASGNSRLICNDDEDFLTIEELKASMEE